MSTNKQKQAQETLARATQISYLGDRPWKLRALATSAALVMALVLAPDASAKKLKISVSPQTAETMSERLSARRARQAENSGQHQRVQQQVTPRSTVAYQTPFVELGALDSKPGESKNRFLLRAGKLMAQEAEMGGRETCGMIMVNEANDAWRVRVISNQQHFGCVNLRFNEPGFVPSGETIHTHAVRGNLKLEEAQAMSVSELSHGPGYLVAGGSVFKLQHELARVERVGRYNLRGASDDTLVKGNYTGHPLINEAAQTALLREANARKPGR